MNKPIEVAVSKLMLSQNYQARRSAPTTPVQELADSIAAQGLLQNLVVTKGNRKGFYEVVAGGRRLMAIQSLVADERWPKDATVFAHLVEHEAAFEASLTENVQREAMHPADEFAAFAALVDQGYSVEDVAARFGVTPTVVRRRLRLAQVAPELIQAYRSGEMTLDALMAFTVSEDHAAQLEVWKALAHYYQKEPGDIRRRLTQCAITAAHPMARYVGLAAYHGAGGQSFQDLFAQDEEHGIYLQDVPLLERLTLEKLQEHAAQIENEGWAWVDVRSSYDSEWYGLQRVCSTTGIFSAQQQSQLDAITARLQVIESEMDKLASNDEEDSQEWDALCTEQDELQAQHETIEEQAQYWPESVKAYAGVAICLDSRGQVRIDRGLVRPEDRRRVGQVGQSATGQRDEIDDSGCEQHGYPKHSERLVRQLTANKVGIVAANLANRPQVALAVLVAQLARQVLGSGYFACGDYGLGVRLSHEALEQHAPDYRQSKAAAELARLRAHWMDTLPLDENGCLSDQVLDWALQQDGDTLMELLAYLVATSVQGVQHHESSSATTLDRLAAVAGVDITQWWVPTVGNYLGHINKGQLVAAVTDALDEQTAQPLAKMKKAEAAQRAEQLLVETSWIPWPLRVVSQQTA